MKPGTVKIIIVCYLLYHCSHPSPVTRNVFFGWK